MLTLFSERARFAICYRPSVRRLSVCNTRAPYPGGCNFRQFFTAFSTLANVYGDHPRGTPVSGELNTKGSQI